ncbi:hypothetical protein [Flavobacterium sp. JP2137]|uniref:hypothetical protein n=1 Tax=Flavobacterium sp. JP2137 TaxID=3414510 RepID=UPI003D2FFAE7
MNVYTNDCFETIHGAKQNLLNYLELLFTNSSEQEEKEALTESIETINYQSQSYGENQILEIIISPIDGAYYIRGLSDYQNLQLLT